MKRTGIFGAGQAGAMTANWLPVNENLICYIDNNEENQGTHIGKKPVFSLTYALELNLDKIWISVLNKEAAIEIEKQIKKQGFTGEVIKVQEFRERQDIRLAALRLIIEQIKERKIPGEMAELGVYQGELAKEMNRLLPGKKLYLFDTFEGFNAKDIDIEKELGSKRAADWDFSDTSIKLVKRKLSHPNNTVICKGHFPDSLKKIEKLPFLSLVSLDPDLYEPVYQGLQAFYPMLSQGGIILIHDYNNMQFPGVKRAVNKYCEEQELYVVPLMDLHGTAVLMKQR